ncbi:MAG: prepilin-type N-terminal cleavage/methylation domain-containing protein [Candidatus Omnitrophica bacterium]|nr:prepilin-type N-terminal cleavage/methylation domain-containing protein [Candidatus Omnitrophota bacterium]
MFLNFIKAKRSFTFIEIIMVIVILGIISAAVGTFVIELSIASARSSEYTTAMNLARMEMEVVNNLPYASITSLTTNNYNGYLYTVVRTVSFVFGDALSAESLKQILIQVRKSGSTDNLATLYTYIAKNVTAGL